MFTTLCSSCPLLFRMYAFVRATWFSSCTPLRLSPYGLRIVVYASTPLSVRLDDRRIPVSGVAQHATILGWCSCSSSSPSSTRLLYPEFCSGVVAIQVGTRLYRQDSSRSRDQQLAASPYPPYIQTLVKLTQTTQDTHPLAILHSWRPKRDCSLYRLHKPDSN